MLSHIENKMKLGVCSQGDMGIITIRCSSQKHKIEKNFHFSNHSELKKAIYLAGMF